MEILAFVAAIVVGFEIEGLHNVPERAFQKLGTAGRKPVKDACMRIRRREGGGGGGGEVEL
jgi:hypothetical protein